MQTVFNVQLIAKKANHTETEVHQVLKKLSDKEIISYQAKNNDATLIFNEIREDERTINRVGKYLENQNSLKIAQLKSVLNYVNDDKTCKSELISTYFGEIATKSCGICSFCISKENMGIDYKLLSEKIIGLLKIQDMNSREIEKLSKYKTSDVIFAIQQLLENESIIIKPNNKYTLKI